MSTHLVVAHQTASNPELHRHLKAVQTKDPSAHFVLVVPATPPNEMLNPGAKQVSVETAASEAKQAMVEAGIAIDEVRVGDGLPLKAIEQEVEKGERSYDSLILCTLPPNQSRWMGMDLPGRLKRRLPGLPVQHVVANPRPDQL